MRRQCRRTARQAPRSAVFDVRIVFWSSFSIAWQGAALVAETCRGKTMGDTVKPPPNSWNPTRRSGFGQSERVHGRPDQSELARGGLGETEAGHAYSQYGDRAWRKPAMCDVPTAWPIFGWSGASAVAAASPTPRRQDELKRRPAGAQSTSVRSAQGGRGREERTPRGERDAVSRSRGICCRAGESRADGSRSADAYEASEARRDGSHREVDMMRGEAAPTSVGAVASNSAGRCESWPMPGRPRAIEQRLARNGLRPRSRQPSS